MKRARFVGGFLVAVLALSACGGDAGSADREAGAEGAPAAVQDEEVAAWLEEIRAEHEGEEVVLLMASHPGTTAFQEIVAPFEEATGVTVSFEVLEEGAMVEKLLLECGREGNTYDLYMVAAEAVARMSETGCAHPLNERIDGAPDFFAADDIMPAYRDLMVNADDTWAIPFAGESVFLMYRRDLFEQEGVEVPETWDELREVARQFDEQGEIDGVSFRARRGWEFTYQYSVFLFPFGGMIVDPASGEPAIDREGSVAALDYMNSLKPFAPVGIEAFSFPEAWQAMQNGQVAMLVEATAAAPELEDPDKSTVAGNVGYAPLPEGPAGAFTGVWGWGLGINGHSERKDLAWDVITWLTGQQTHQTYIDAGGIPSRQSAFEDAANQERFPYFEAVGQALEQAESLAEADLSVVPKHSLWYLFSETIGDFGSQSFAGQIDAEEAVTGMQEEMERTLEEGE